MRLKGKLTISRDSTDTMQIRLTDNLSGRRFATARLSPHDFAMAITGLSYIEVDLDVNDLDKVGLRREVAPRRVKCPLITSDKEVLQKWLLENCQEPGWEINTYLGSQNSVVRVGDDLWLNYTLSRYLAN